MTDPFGFVAHRPVTEQVLEGATRYFAVEEHTPSGWKIPQYDTQRQINGCHMCPWPECKNCLGKTERKERKQAVRKELPPVPTDSPCHRCYSRRVCVNVGGTCGDRVRWEERLNGAGSCLWASEIEAFPIAVTRVRFEEGDQHGKR